MASTSIVAIIKPKSRKGPLVERQTDGSYIVYVREPAHAGQANAGAVHALAEHLKIAPSNIELTHGHKGKKKVFTIF